MRNMKRSIAVLITCAFRARHGGARACHRRQGRRAFCQYRAARDRSRAAAATPLEAAAQVPGAAGVLLEALRWRGRTAQQIGLPTKLWCADFMNFVLRRAGGKGTHSRAARSFLEYGKKLDGPRVGAIAILYRKGPNNGHVGVVRGTDGQGNPIIVSGNHGHTVRAVGLSEEQGPGLCDAAAIRARRHGGGRARARRAPGSRQRVIASHAARQAGASHVTFCMRR